MAALATFVNGAISQSVFSFDLPLTGRGVVEITGSEGTLVVPDPNYFDGAVKITRAPTYDSVVDGKVVSGSTNPIVDSHWHEALLLIISVATLSADTWGVGKWWGNLGFVKRHRWLR